MSSRPTRPAAIAALAVLLCGLVAGHGGDTATVAVDASRFQPFDVHVAPGGSVTWDVREAGHTIVADDGRFDARGEGGGTIAPGATVTHTFSEVEEVVRYFCTKHGGPGGQGMAGVVVVGDPQPERPPTPVIRVPADVATVTDAVAVAGPGDVIELAPGRHAVERPLLVELSDPAQLPRGLSIVGTGSSAGDVVLAAALVPQLGPPASIVHVTGAFIALRNLTVDASLVTGDGAGIHLDGARQVELVDVVVDGGGWARDAVLVTDADGAALRGVTTRGARRAGVAVEPCAACGVRLDGLTTHDNLVGVLATGATGVLVRSAEVRSNAAGIVARAHGPRTTTLVVAGSSVVGNTRRTGLPPLSAPDRRLATGAGVWLDGSSDSTVHGSVVHGQSFGIVLGGGALRDRVVANQVTGNGTDLAWDGLGADTCFSDNVHGSSSPAALQTINPCGRPTVGVPNPLVPAALTAAAYT